MGNSLSLDAPHAIHLLTNVPGKAAGVSSTWALLSCGKLGRSSWLSPGHCVHLGLEPADGQLLHISLPSLTPYFT